MTSPPEADHPALPDLDQAAWATLEQATVLATGPDAVRFVDNFVTASVSSAAVGGGTEAFATDGRGHVIALVTILRTEDGVEIVAPAGLGERLRDHLEHFHIREAVEITDSSDTTAAILVTGAEASALLASLMPASETPPTQSLDHRLASVARQAVRVVRVTNQGPDGFWIRGSRDAIDAVAQALAAAAPQASTGDLEAARIATGYPAAIDIVDKTLPQELGRDALAISFTKGCYLGQETVARLDALGHVNRRLVILGIESIAPVPCPAPILRGDQLVGTLTSSARAPDRNVTLGLAIIHTRALEAASLTINATSARVLAIPPKHLDSP